MSIIPSSGPVSFSLIQSIFGGPATNISLSSYYTNANGGYTTGVTGIHTSGNPILITQFLGKAKATSVWYSVTLTPCGASYNLGPTLAQCQSSYVGQVWLTSLSMTSQGCQQLTITNSGNYTITVFGAMGGRPGTNSGYNYGRKIEGTYALSNGQILTVIVGQMGHTCGANNDRRKHDFKLSYLKIYILK